MYFSLSAFQNHILRISLYRYLAKLWNSRDLFCEIEPFQRPNLPKRSLFIITLIEQRRHYGILYIHSVQLQHSSTCQCKSELASLSCLVQSLGCHASGWLASQTHVAYTLCTLEILEPGWPQWRAWQSHPMREQDLPKSNQKPLT